MGERGREGNESEEIPPSARTRKRPAVFSFWLFPVALIACLTFLPPAPLYQHAEVPTWGGSLEIPGLVAFSCPVWKTSVNVKQGQERQKRCRRNRRNITKTFKKTDKVYHLNHSVTLPRDTNHPLIKQHISIPFLTPPTPNSLSHPHPFHPIPPPPPSSNLVTNPFKMEYYVKLTIRTDLTRP
ncbi:hypothetical protein L249_1227 [Ophiocordyceps polyrhachis-furcata BCC 54312]|uniref:Uncharacterized protein n=1 Tax=Ophiocordyceps polyrhachis-furcata BCC 54312 TaxID=1330021 RepID=A0A367LCM1_9HYPO|nr:hypothetical protein L249_1227 [Ophiocordyceps polyrhachis-furcata BCC 54312]